MKCRHCAQSLHHLFLDLGSAPPSNAYVAAKELQVPDTLYPLRLLVCESCWLVQTEDYAGAETLFNDQYAYFSSFSTSWLAHAQAYVQLVQKRFGLHSDSFVVEIAANDGYLLQYVMAAGIPCLGIEPTASTAATARARKIPIIEDFFGQELAHRLIAEGKTADLITANNVLAHVPQINDFASGIQTLLKPQGVATFEFPHLLRLLEGNQFDTVYHEHFSYLSLGAVDRILATSGLQVFDVDILSTHGGSLRIYVQRADTGCHQKQISVDALHQSEIAAGLETTAYYQNFQARAKRLKDDLLACLVDAKRRGIKVAGYGAAAKGNTLLNFAGVRGDLLPYIADRNPAKQGKFMPGSRIPIVDENTLKAHRPELILLLPWNLRDELLLQLSYAREWGAKFVTAVPALEIL